jgi:hypothetical protein
MHITYRQYCQMYVHAMNVPANCNTIPPFRWLFHHHHTFTHRDLQHCAPPTATHPHNGPWHHNCMCRPAGHSTGSLTWGSDGPSCDAHHPCSRSLSYSHNAVMDTCKCSVPHHDIRHSCTTWSILHICDQCHLPCICHNNGTHADLDLVHTLLHACCTTSLSLTRWGRH